MSSQEIERKFLAKNEEWKKEEAIDVLSIRQIYFKSKDGFNAYFKKIDNNVELHLQKDQKTFLVEKLSPKDSYNVLNEKTISFDNNGIFNLEEDLGWAVRMRKTTSLINIGNHSFCEFTVKGKSVGISRPEFNIKTEEDGICSIIILNYDEEEKPYISKIRHILKHDDNTCFEIDEFKKPFHMNGVVLIEIEIPNENYQIKNKSWLGKEVSTDPKYFNSNLM